jgi:type II secretory pathway component PulJ
MSTNTKKISGYTLIELVLVMLLLILLGVTAFSLVVSGSHAYKNMMNSKEANSQLRVALSYTKMKIRQNDTYGSIRIEKNPVGVGNAIVVLEKVEEKEYETWIYWDEHRLRESIVLKGEAVNNGKSTEIAEIDGFKVDYSRETGCLSIDVWSIDNGKRKTESSVIVLKAAI